MKACLQVGIGLSLQGWGLEERQGKQMGSLPLVVQLVHLRKGLRTGGGGRVEATGGAGIQPSVHQDCAWCRLQIP